MMVFVGGCTFLTSQRLVSPSLPQEIDSDGLRRRPHLSSILDLEAFPFFTANLSIATAKIQLVLNDMKQNIAR